jgi:acyl transferase domain-containing protein
MAPKTNEKINEISHQLRKTPVAIIGMASIFAQAKNLEEYWQNILNKIDAVTDVPASRWSVEDYYDPDPSKPDKSYCKRGGFIPDIDFDPTEFGLPPNILEVTDVSQLLSLVVARDALNDAGYGEGREFKRDTTGVILGVVGVSSKIYVPLTSRLQYPVWERVLKASGLSDEDTRKVIEKFKLAYVGWEENSFPGSLTNVVSGRVANRFDLGGTNCVLDAACATSMAAIKMAIMELVEGRADMMLTGGVDTDNSIGVYMSFSKTPAFSKGQAVRTFDADSDGMMAGEGIGMVVLKRLADAERDGDRIYAVIRGVGSSSDGRFKSIYAPRPGGQSVALRRAYDEAGYSPDTLGLIEAHGTGTPAGDPAEFQGLRETLNDFTQNRQYIAIGSVKSQIAHTKGAAGVAGLIKISLALHHKILPATINVKKPNPKLDIGNSAFYINTETRPWFRHNAKTPRRAGVSSFGFGGTNFHLTVEEYAAEHSHAYRTHNAPVSILLSAPTAQALIQNAKQKLVELKSEQGKWALNQLANQSDVLQIPQSHARFGFVAASLAEAQELLQTGIDFMQQKPDDIAWEHPKGLFYRKNGLETQGKVVALFSGQGSQYLEMGRELACNFPPVRQVIDEMDMLFAANGLAPLSSRIYPRPVFNQEDRDQQSEVLTQTEHAQPAIGSISVGLYKLLGQAGFKADFVAGHSFGELTALWAAQVLSDQDYYKLAKARGKAMSRPDDPNFDTGTMLAVKGDAHKVKEEIQGFPEITLANWNSDSQVVLAGSKPAIAAIQQHLTDKGYSVVLLPVSAAFHTPLVGHAQKPFAQAIGSTKFKKPAVRVFSNTTAKAHSSDPAEISKLLAGHILNPVLFRDEIENIYAEGGFFFIEFGPKNVLTNLVKNILNDRPHLAVALNASPKKDSDRQLREAAVQLRVAGLPLGNIDPYQTPRKTQPGRKNSPVTVKLNGGCYVSPKTQAAFENALKDGFKIKPDVQIKEVIKEVVVEKTVAVQAAAQTFQPIPSALVNASGLEQNLAQFREHQSQVLHLHEQYLKNEETFAGIYAKLSEMEIALVSNAEAAKMASILPVFEGLERSMARFHEHQAETLRVHSQYLQSQEEFARNYAHLIEQQMGFAPTVAASVTRPVIATMPAPVVSTPEPVRTAPVAQPAHHFEEKKEGTNGFHGNGAKAAAPAAEPAKPAATLAAQPQAIMSSTAYTADNLTKALLEIVSEKTGYPVEMLELDTDMEADLGIDSIKRVEIMGAMRTRFPSLPKADPEAFAEVRTLGQTVQYMLASAPASAPEIAAAAASTSVQPFAPVSVTPVTSTGPGEKELTQALLEVVSEKTGYPVEMLELDTDMEADLGIDSIKRVEIMGAMRTRFPSLPKADPEAFAEVRTLGQTVSYMSSSSGATASVEVIPVVDAPLASKPAAAQPSGIDMDALKQGLLAIVSEKTGYPVEMLELDTDMEADLGIDSIKRVEIMGALRNQFPALPKADPEAFAEVRTLGQIINYLGNSAGSTPKAETAETIPAYEPVDPSIPRGVVNLKELPAPDFLNFALPSNHICLVTDNGTAETSALVSELSSLGWKVAVLSFPGAVIAQRAALPAGVSRTVLPDLSEEQLQKSLAEISEKVGPVGAFIHLNPPFSGAETNELFSSIEKQIIKQIFLIAKHLKEPLSAAAKLGTAAFLVVVHLDGQFGLGNEIDYSPVSGGLFGLVKTVNLEWEAVYCRAIDISPALDQQTTQRIVTAELFDPNRRINEVGYSKAGRMTLVVEQAAKVLE